MSYKPDESTLVAYLYDELNSEERMQVEQYLKTHPKEQKEIEEIAATRKLMGKWQDKEVLEPTFVFDHSNVVLIPNKSGKLNFLIATIGVAASFSLLMLVAFFTNFSITKNDAGVQVGFGVPMETQDAVHSNISEDTIKRWLVESAFINNEQLIGRISEFENSFTQELALMQRAYKKKSSTVLLDNTIDESVLQSYVEQLKNENKEILLSLMGASENVQRQYINQLLVDYSLFMEEQRQSDLQLIQTSFNNLKDNTEVSQIETNQILASIITTVNNQNN